MISVPEAAQRAKRNPETIRRWIREGKLTSWKVGTQYLIDEDDLSDAIRGIFAGPPAPDEGDAPMTSAQIVSDIHGGRAERARRLQEVMTPYLVASPETAAVAMTASDTWLPHIVGRIVRAVDPARIILFGSRARGDSRPDSDYDLLVVLDELTHRREARIDIRRSFADLPVAADVLVATVAEVEGRPAGAAYWAIHEGRRVYDRGDAG